MLRYRTKLEEGFLKKYFWEQSNQSSFHAIRLAYFKDIVFILMTNTNIQFILKGLRNINGFDMCSAYTNQH